MKIYRLLFMTSLILVIHNAKAMSMAPKSPRLAKRSLASPASRSSESVGGLAKEDGLPCIKACSSMFKQKSVSSVLDMRHAITYLL